MPPDCREWLLTDGIGGYALSTPSGLHTRRYHGLLVSATTPPTGRSVLLARLEEELEVSGRRHPLSVAQYDTGLHPRGDLALVDFSRDPFPTFVYEAGGVRLRKTIALLRGESTLVIRWHLVTGPAVPTRLVVRPLLALRDHHALRHEESPLDGTLTADPSTVTVQPWSSQPPLHFSHRRASLDGSAVWYRRQLYEIERQRGFDFEEDLFSPFSLTFDLDPRETATLVVSTRPRGPDDAEELLEAEISRLARSSGQASSPPLLRALHRAADQFVVVRDGGLTVLAGYPWFTDWGRDAMISLPGLALATGRRDLARRTLETFARHVDRGMIPSRFTDAGSPEYDAADATLWFIEAVRACRAEGRDDEEFIRDLYPLLLMIVEEHVRGTRHGIQVDRDGLLSTAPDGIPLTWMDARVGGAAVTPRHGKPVEIQALWYNALSFLVGLSQDLRDGFQAGRLASFAARVRESFERLFWNEETGCLLDVVDGSGRPDPSIRPNQLLALGLAYPLVGGRRGEAVLEVVERDLLTPFGLRTLAPSDPRYRGRYEGSPEARDTAYHQGTVWPWLLGPYLDAVLKVRGDTPEVRSDAARRLKPLCDHLTGPGLGQLPEVFDGDPPHRPNGCPAQAWSVAELSRCLTLLGSGDADGQSSADRRRPGIED